MYCLCRVTAQSCYAIELDLFEVGTTFSTKHCSAHFKGASAFVSILRSSKQAKKIFFIIFATRERLFPAIFRFQSPGWNKLLPLLTKPTDNASAILPPCFCAF